MYTIYILRSSSANKIYIGQTKNLQKRVEQHQKGNNRSTKLMTDWVVIYSESYSSRSLAMKREKFLKTGDGKKVIRLKGIIN